MTVPANSTASSSTTTISSSLTPQRKHHKLLKDGSGQEVWPKNVESIFVQGLKSYRDSPWATYSRGRSRWRNQFLVDYLQSAGIIRTKKQVASHIQVLRNMWKGEPDFDLVSGGEVSAQLRAESRPKSKSKSKSPSPVKAEDEQKPLFNLSSPTPTLFSPSPAHTVYDPSDISAKVEYSPPSSTHSSPLTSYSIPSLQAPSLEPSHLSMPFLPTANTLTSLHISSPGVPPVSVPVDLTAIGSSIPVFKFSLVAPSPVDFLCPVDMEGFEVQLDMLQQWSRCRTLTRVFSAGTCMTQEYGTVYPSPFGSQDFDNIGVSPLTLPASALSKCRWLNFGSQLRISQQVNVDGNIVAYVLYEVELSQTMGSYPSVQSLGVQYRPLQSSSPNIPHQPSSAPIQQLPYPLYNTSCAGYGVPPVAPTSVSF